MSNEIKLGSIVQLRSGGGPVMTVLAIDGNGLIQCVWYKGGQFLTEKIAAHILKVRVDLENLEKKRSR